MDIMMTLLCLILFCYGLEILRFVFNRKEASFRVRLVGAIGNLNGNTTVMTSSAPKNNPYKIKINDNEEEDLTWLLG